MKIILAIFLISLTCLLVIEGLNITVCMMSFADCKQKMSINEVRAICNLRQ